MKKIIYFLALTTFLSLAFVSCDNKDEADDEEYEDLTLVVGASTFA